MQELITEIAIYLAIAAVLGLILGYLFWGMGSRRRIEAARAEGAAEVRTSVDGGSSLRTQVDALTHERDRLLHRVEVLSIRVATLMESNGGTANADEVAEEMGTIRLDVSDNPGDRMDDAARSFPEPIDATVPPMSEEVSIFDVPNEREAPDPDAADRDETTDEDSIDARSETSDADERDTVEPTAQIDDTELLETPEESGEASAAAVGLFERWPVEPPLRIRKDSPAEGEAAEATEQPDMDPDDMPPVPLRPRKPATSEEDEILPLRRRPLFAAAQSLKPDPKPAPEPDEADLPHNRIGAAVESGLGASEPGDLRSEDQTDDANASRDTGASEEDERAAANFNAEIDAGTSGFDEQRPDVPGLEIAGDPERADDLTRIKGIGKSTAKSLNALGIWQFDQIAGLGLEGLDWLRGKLSAQMGRSIDKWPDQARTLADLDDG